MKEPVIHGWTIERLADRIAQRLFVCGVPDRSAKAMLVLLDGQTISERSEASLATEIEAIIRDAIKEGVNRR